MTSILGLPVHCGSPVYLERWTKTRDVSCSEWTYICSRCGLTGLAEVFDPHFPALDHLLCLPIRMPGGATLKTLRNLRQRWVAA
jgi:hypothetical protein